MYTSSYDIFNKTITIYELIGITPNNPTGSNLSTNFTVDNKM